MTDFTEITSFPITLPIEKINKRLKLPRNYNDEMILKEIKSFIPLMETIARFKALSLKIEGEIITIDNKYSFVSSSLSKHLFECEKVTLLAVSLGIYLEQKIEKFQNSGKTLKVIIGDAVGSEYVEESAKYISEIIGRSIKKKGFIPTKRFSPGYGDLSLEVQNIFFEELILNEIGINLNDSLLMTPQKSITAFIGWKNS